MVPIGVVGSNGLLSRKLLGMHVERNVHGVETNMYESTQGMYLQSKNYIHIEM